MMVACSKKIFQVQFVFALRYYLVYVVDKLSEYKLVNAKQPLPSEDGPTLKTSWKHCAL